MASGFTVTSNPDPAQLQSLGLTSWPIWGCEISAFPWTYDEQEICLLLEGDVTVTPDGLEDGQSGADADPSPAQPPREHRGDGAQHARGLAR